MCMRLKLIILQPSIVRFSVYVYNICIVRQHMEGFISAHGELECALPEPEKNVFWVFVIFPKRTNVCSDQWWFCIPITSDAFLSVSKLEWMQENLVNELCGHRILTLMSQHNLSSIYTSFDSGNKQIIHNYGKKFDKQVSLEGNMNTTRAHQFVLSVSSATKLPNWSSHSKF